MTYESPGDKRFIDELIESFYEYSTDDLISDYIEERRYEYRKEWFEFLEALDKE